MNLKMIRALHYGKRFKKQPWLLVIHSGANASGVAEFFSRIGYVLRKDGSKVFVSAHVAWSKREDNFVQCVPMNRIAFHAGGSVFRDEHHINQCSIGIELPGPWKKARDISEKMKFRQALEQVIEEVPSLTTAVRHRDIDAGKHDPGDGFTKDWLYGFNLEIAW